MRVETYSDRYFLDVVKLIKNFHEEAVSEYDQEFNSDAVIETIKTADHANSYLLIVDEVCQGILSGTMLRSPNNGSGIFQEVIWYVNKPFRRYGVQLLRVVENTLKSIGVSTMIMVALENSKSSKLKTFYERLGYKPMETHYVRNL